MVVLDNGDWLISWARERAEEKAGYGNVEKAITQVDPKTGTRKLAFDIPNPSNTSVQANIRATAIPAYALAPQPVALSAAAPASDRTSLFHKGDDDTPQVLVTFNRPVVDFATTSPSLSVSGGTVTAVSALVADGEPANAYLFTLDPAGEGAVTLRLLANKACADGGICAADGTTLKQALTAVVTPAPLVSFQRATYSAREGTSGSVVVRLSRAHQAASGVTIPIVLDSGASSASQADFAPDFATAQSVTFERGETSKTFRIQAATDTLVEGDETVVLGFGTLPDVIGMGSTSTTTVTLADRTTASFDFSRLEGELPEGASATFTLRITNGVTFAEAATINLAVSGSAGSGDFTLEAGGSTLSAPYSVTLPAGASSTSFTIRATDDSTAEPTDESVTISATLGLANVFVGGRTVTNAPFGSRTVTIPPSDVANVPDVTISAGGGVTEGEATSFTLQRTGATTAALTVSVRVVATGASLSASAPSTASFAAGSATASLSLATRDDTVVREAGGQVAVYLIGSSTNPPTYLTTPTNHATVAVSENDAANFTVTASAEQMTEGQTLVVTVDTGGVTFPDAQPIELRLSGSATAGSDYTLPGGCTGSTCVSTLQRGAQTARASFRTRYDGAEEGIESIFIDAYHDGTFIGAVSVNLLDGAAPPVVSGPSGGGGGGGGGGAPPVPVPSDADFDWNVTRDINSLDRGNQGPTGLWSQNGTLYVLNNAASGPDSVFAYTLQAGERDEEREITLARRNRFAHGIWSDGKTAWVSDSGQDRIFAYDLETRERVESRELTLAERNRDPRGIWSDGVLMYVLDSVKDALFLYDMKTGELLAEHALDSLNKSPRGIWSDGFTLWVSDDGAKRVFAYRIEPGADSEPALKRYETEEFSFRSLLKAGNGNPRGIWSDGNVLWVADEQDAKVYSYNLPDEAVTLLSALALTDVKTGEFAPDRHTYSGNAAAKVKMTTVTATPLNESATIAIAPEDADSDPENGHHVALTEPTEVRVTVTSADGLRHRVYRVQVTPANAAPEPGEPAALRLELGEPLRELSLAEHFRDADADPLMYRLVLPPDGAVAAARLDAGTVQVTPLAIGDTEFALTATDGEATSAPWRVSVTVVAPEPEDAVDRIGDIRIAARAVADGRIEFALQTYGADGGWSERLLPRARFLPTSAAVGRWRVSTPLALGETDGSARIVARRNTDGRTEFGLQLRLGDETWGELLLPGARFLPAQSALDRWLVSGSLDVAVDADS